MKHRSQIYILESVNSEDLKLDRCEGSALFEALKLAELNPFFWAVANRGQLMMAIEEIQTHLGPLIADEKIVPFFHISAHGNERGIGLTNGDFVTWSELRLLLWAIGERTNRIKYDWALAHITMSSCKGIYGAEMLMQGQSPAISLIGSNENLQWSDALTAWIVFYHLVLLKDAQPPAVIDIVNAAAGTNSIQFWMARGNKSTTQTA